MYKTWKTIRQLVRNQRHEIQLFCRRLWLRLYFCINRAAIIEIHVPKMGFFAHLSWIAAALDWAKKNNFKLHFRCTNPQYNRMGRTDDWLGPFFLQNEPPSGSRFRIAEYGEFPFGTVSFQGKRNYVRNLFHNSFEIRPEFIADCEKWFTRKFEQQFVVGLHYRGSDKHVEAPRLAYSVAISSLKRVIALLHENGVFSVGVFIATDDLDFLSSARAEFDGTNVHALDDICRSNSSIGVHQLGLRDGAALAREAMMDAILLSRTHLLIKTASLLSGWAALLGRDMPILLLNRPYEGSNFYPDCVLAEEGFSIGQEANAVKLAVALFDRGACFLNTK